MRDEAAHLAEEAACWQTWRDALRNPAVNTEVEAIYSDLEDAIAQRGAICWASGRCCHFEKFGHRLYVTGLEIARAIIALQSDDRPADAPALPTTIDLHGDCVFQVNKLCQLRALRPLGCRVFFCMEGTEDWQHEQYERLLQRLQSLHTQHALPYRYMEWRAGLAAGIAELAP